MGIPHTIAAAAAILAAAATTVAAARTDAKWSYVNGPTGPAHWGELSPASEYAGCAVGVPHQSPINVPAKALRSKSGRLSLGDAATLHRTRLALVSSTHSVHFECPEAKEQGGHKPHHCGVTHWDGRAFHLKNVHVRWLHTVCGAADLSRALFLASPWQS